MAGSAPSRCDPERRQEHITADLPARPTSGASPPVAHTANFGRGPARARRHRRTGTAGSEPTALSRLGFLPDPEAPGPFPPQPRRALTRRSESIRVRIARNPDMAVGNWTDPGTPIVPLPRLGLIPSESAATVCHSAALRWTRRFQLPRAHGRGFSAGPGPASHPSVRTTACQRSESLESSSLEDGVWNLG